MSAVTLKTLENWINGLSKTFSYSLTINVSFFIAHVIHYPLVAKLDRCFKSCNTLNDLSNKVCVPNKTEDSNLSMFNMITGINESKTLTEHISCECKCRVDGKNLIQINDRIMINVTVSVKNVMYMKKIIFIMLYMWLRKWNIFGKYYGWFSNYVWWNYRIIQWRNKNYSNKF